MTNDRGDLNGLLSRRELVGLLEVAAGSLDTADENGFRSIVRAFQELTPFEYAVSAWGNLLENRRRNRPKVAVVDVSYPAGYIHHYLSHGYHLCDLVVDEFFESRQPVHWVESVFCRRREITYTQSIDAEAFGFRDGWTYGTFSPASGTGTLFWLGGPRLDRSRRTRSLLRYAVPFLASALNRLDRCPQPPARQNPENPLSTAEVEVLKWLKEGKTSWEISVILGRSRRVVDFHVENIKKKLGAANRTDAVVAALEQGVIDF